MLFPSLRDLGGAARQAAARLGEAGEELRRTLRDTLPQEAPAGVGETIERALGSAFGSALGRGPAPPPTPEAARFLSARFGNEAGERPYKLYVPGRPLAGPAPLVMMLHGCTQSPDDFAAGTRMNELAEAEGFLACYPAQTQSANHSRCWNWFNVDDQARGRGEPSLIAGIARRVMAGYPVDPRRVYVAGLSAGGALASIMGSAYPDLFAAVGVHSGLACGAAYDLQSAFAAMRQGAPSVGRGRAVPTIVFHGDRDTTVNPANADAVLAQSRPAEMLGRVVTRGQVPGGYRYEVIAHVNDRGVPLLEQWVVHGAGHAWSGGSAAGSFTDPKGPDATAAMWHFFRQHQLASAD